MTTELKSKLEKKAERAENLRSFQGTKLIHIKSKIEDMLKLIGMNGIFLQYTKHDISHIDEMIRIAEWLIPDETFEFMTDADCLMLVLSIYFHDLGLLVTNKEYKNRNSSKFTEFVKRVNKKEFGEEYLEKVNSLGEDKDKFLYQEYVRSIHATRVKNWITGKFSFEDGECSDAIKEINDILKPLSDIFKRDLGIICESHHKDDLDDFEKYKTACKYGNDPQEVVNLHYIAIILRTADLLHITSDRTPSVQYNLIDISDPISMIEWQKQKAVYAIGPKDKMTQEGIIDKTLEKDTIEICAYFSKSDEANAFFGLMSYIRYAKKELKNNYELVKKSIKYRGTDKYQFHWKEIDDTNIQTTGFEPRQLKFNLDQASILQLLVGHTLYNDSSVVVREIVQNALDAIKLQNTIERRQKEKETEGIVNIKFDSQKRELTFLDNGTGMTIYEVENYLLKVGASRYRAEDFKKQHPEFNAISRFGIGILTCFLIANDIDIITNSVDSACASMISLRNVNGKYLLKNLTEEEVPKEVKKHGTLIILKVRYDVDMTNILENLKKWIIFPGTNVIFKQDNQEEILIGYNNPSEALTKYLENKGINIEKNNIEIRERKSENVILAYAVKYDKYSQVWRLLGGDDFERDIQPEKRFIGTCIEGIRVESSTPGFIGANILAIANVKGSAKIRTNVARSAIELNEEKDILLESIYKLYIGHIKEEVENLNKKGYSLSWAMSEVQSLISPLIKSNNPYIYYDNERNNIAQNSELLNAILNSLKCLIVEKDKKRMAMSPDELNKLEEVYIIDTQMVYAAEMLLREVQTETTVCELIDIVNKSNNIIQSDKHIICNFSHVYRL